MEAYETTGTNPSMTDYGIYEYQKMKTKQQTNEK